MLPLELKLTSLRHCFVHLPETFVSKESGIKGGSIVSIRSLQADKEIFVMWNGLLTPGEHVQLDLSFAQANGFKDELIIVSPAENLPMSECEFCRVELLDPSEISILGEHTETNLLDTCKLISKDLIVPLIISQHVHVLVKVLSFEPSQPFGLLTNWTRMNYEHGDETKLNNEPEGDAAKEAHSVVNHIPLVSCVLNIDYRAKFHLGSVLVCGERGSGKSYLLDKILKDYKPNYGELVDCKQFRAKRPEAVKKKFQELIDSATEKHPAIICLDDIDSILSNDAKHEEEQGQEVIYKKRLVDAFCFLLKQIERKARLIALVASCRSIESLDMKISNPIGRRYFNQIITLKPPNLHDRSSMLKNIIDQQKVRCSIDDKQFDDIAQKCASYMPSDLVQLYERALINACSRSSLEFSSDPMIIQFDDFIKSIDGYVPINLRAISLQPKTTRTFDNVGGMKAIKDELIATVLLPIKYPKLYAKCPLRLQNSVLLYGPPGCGKTLIAEALINQEGINSICVRGPELLSKYIGASEAAVRDLFHRAHLAQPCVIFFDEFESLVAKRGSDSTGVTDRVVNQFLTILDGVESLSQGVYIIAASSRPDMIDPAMLRPGRLAKHIYCPVPNEFDRCEILSVLSKEMSFSDDITSWSRKLEGFTGADIQAFLYTAQLKALHNLVDAKSPSPTQTTTTTPESSSSCSKDNNDHDLSPALSAENRANLVINITNKHLFEAFDELKHDVEARLANLIKKYPPTIGVRAGERISTRATLA